MSDDFLRRVDLLTRGFSWIFMDQVVDSDPFPGFLVSKFYMFHWEFQDPKMEVLYHIRPYFVGIFPYIGLT